MSTQSKFDAHSVAEHLAQITFGWTPVPGIAAETLSSARQALASSLLQGLSRDDVYAAQQTVPATTLNDPALYSDLHAIVLKAGETALPASVAVVRGAMSADTANPLGKPAWARGAKVSESFGPFLDTNGILQWVDLLHFTVSTKFSFDGGASFFATIPISEFLLPPIHPTKLTLGGGSLWFLANWLSSSFPSSTFTGFSIVGGTLESTVALDLKNGSYVVPAGAKLTVTATLAPVGSISAGSDSDASNALFTPPTQVTLVFTQGHAQFTAIADSTVTAYGSTVGLHWSNQAPTALTELPLLFVPTTSSATSFAFQDVLSTLFVPSGIAVITSACWALPLANVAITALPEAAGPGSGVLELGAGGSLVTGVVPVSTAVTSWLLEVGTDSIYVLTKAQGAASNQTYTLWPQSAPSKVSAFVEFSAGPDLVSVYLATISVELLLTAGNVRTYLDRPLTAAGKKISFQGTGLLILEKSASGIIFAIIAEQPVVTQPLLSISLENALLGVRRPSLFTLGGTLQDGIVSKCAAAYYFDLRWLLPILPDPYAANFDLSVIGQESDNTSIGTLIAAISWSAGSKAPDVRFTLLESPDSNTGTGNASGGLTGSPFAANATFSYRVQSTQRSAGGVALLDLSTRLDLFGVAVVPNLSRRISDANLANVPAANTPAPALALSGMNLELNGATVATFALPQSSWEPMESTAVGEFGPIYCEPASDGYPLLINAPNTQQLVPLKAGAVLLNNIENVASGVPFSALFSLPFGLNAYIQQENKPLGWKPPSQKATKALRSTFLAEGGQFRLNEPQFQQAIPPSPPPPPGTPTPTESLPPLTGALQLTLMPPHPEQNDAAFSGFTQTEADHGPAPGYGAHILSYQPPPSVTDIFNNAFGESGIHPGVPLRRIDFSGYGASIFSEWTNPDAIPPDIIKVQFDTSIGRTSYEVIKATSIFYPYCVRMVRTITMQRQNAGWVKRTDTGWQPASPGLFQFPPDTAPQYVGRLHKGAMLGVFNVRNIRDLTDQVSIGAFQFQKILFDADIAINPTLKVVNGGFSSSIPGYSDPLTLVASKDMVGYAQLAPDGQSPDPSVLTALFNQVGPLTPAVGCSVEVGSFAGLAGTSMRASAFEVNIIQASNDGNPTPAVGVALRAAPQIPRGGGWSMGRRGYTEPAPSALPNDFPVPLVQSATNTSAWFIAELTDVLQITQPDNFYSLLHSTGTHKILFEQPQIPTSAGTNPSPGLQFAKPNPPAPPKPGAVPVNPGSPNLGDFASILNSTGLFPDLTSVLSLLSGALEQINTIEQGFNYSKSLKFDPTQQVSIIDVGILNIALQYADTTVPAPNTPTPTELTYTVNSAASPSWSLKIAPLSFLVNIPLFGSSPVLTITGGFYADEHTTAGLTDLNVQIGDALSVIKGVFSKLQTLAQFLPGGAGANLDVALSDGKLTVSDSFTIGDLPLGLGDLTDVSLNLGLAVELQPISVDFSIGIGSPDNPFNWIVSPLAGNGLMNFGVAKSAPALVIQAGIGLGLAIDLGIASGSASVTIAVELDINGSGITLMAILTGQASVDVLDGLASVSLTLSAGLGFGLNPAVPLPVFSPAFPAIPTSVTIPSVEITMLATCSVGIHLSICWVASVSWDGSWNFSQSVDTPALTVSI